MKRILVAIILLGLLVSIGSAQETHIDNHVWQGVEQGTFLFRLPPDWINDSNTWQHPEGIGEISLLLDDNAEASRMLLGMTIESEESIILPIANTLKITASNEAQHTIAYIVNTQEQTIALHASYSVNLSDEQASHFTQVTTQIANTLISTEANSESWSLYANSEAHLFLRMPANWTRLSSATDTLSVRETFTDVSLRLQYRDLGRSFELSEIEAQFLSIYNANGYDIQAQEILNLPIGDALFFRLGGVAVTSDSIHTQLYFVVARDNIMIVIVAGVNERYFEEYEILLLQIIDTVQFQAPA